MRIELSYTPQDRQVLLHSTLASEILYGGAAGGGKSHSIRWDGYEFCMKNPGCIAVLVRQTLPQLEKNHIRKVRRELPRELGEYHETRKVFNWWNGSIMAFQHLEYDRDINDFQGDEIHWLGIDEAALLQPDHLAEIKTRLRLGGWSPTDPESILRLPRLVMGSNPGGPSHFYLKEGFKDPAPPETMFDVVARVKNPVTDLFEDVVKTRIFIPATMRDNKYLDMEYAAQFSELPEWRQSQLRDGDWDVIPGAFFDCWDIENIIRPFKVPKHWPRWRSCDWGFATPFWIGEWTVADGSTNVGTADNPLVHPSGTLICTWEWYGQGEKKNVGLRMDAGDVGSEIIRKRGKVKAGPADPSMWRTDSGPSAAEKAHKSGLRFFKGDNQRPAGWQEMYRRIDDNMLLSFTSNTYLNRCIPSLRADPMKPEDVLKEGEDHPGDGARYMCMSRPYKVDRDVPKPDPLAPLRFSDLRDIPERKQRWI